MVNQISPSYTTIGDIFEKNFLFEVPKYQRYYSWEDEQVDDYIKDIDNIYNNTSDENPIEHFFGGIVVVDKPVAGSNRSQRELIDGQQRITTTILLIISLIRKYESLCDGSNTALINSRINKLREKYLIYNDEINRNPTVVPKLTLSNADNLYFDAIINNTVVAQQRDSHKRLHKAYTKIRSYVNNKIDALTTTDDKIDAIAKIEKLIHKNCTIIFIDSKTRESAYKLFQVLNDRGAGLTEGDLLKSKTLESLEKHFSPKQASIESAWDDILQDEPKTIEQFLRYYFASVYGKRVGRTSLYDDFLKKFFPKLVDNETITEESDAIEISNTVATILSEVKTYRKLINGIWPYDSQQPITEWDRKRLDILINFLNFDIVYPILLAGAHLEEKKFAELVHILEKFMFRYKTVCNLGHQKMSDLYMAEAVKIRNDPSNYRLSDLKATLRQYIQNECTDIVFKAGLSNLKYRTSGNNKSLKYLFSTLNEHVEWYATGANGKPKACKASVINYDNVTIEHISAQAATSPLAEFAGEKVHHFYNLTLLTCPENEKVKAKDYYAKKPVYVDSEYVLNSYFSSVVDWDYSEAQKWEEYLKDFACKVFVV